MNKSRFSRRQTSNNTKSDIWDGAGQGPFLRVHKRIFYTDHMFPNLLGQHWVGDQLDQVIDGVDAGVDRLEPLDLLPDGQGVGHVGEVGLVVRHGDG